MPSDDPERGPPTLVRGAFTLESSLGIEALHDSNIFESRTTVQSSQIWKLAPRLLMRFEPARSRLEFGYKGNYGWYDESSDDDYADHALQAGARPPLGGGARAGRLGGPHCAHRKKGDTGCARVAAHRQQ